MSRLQELKEEALSLTDAERAVLASDLLETLPGVLSDEDEGVAEALRRDAELDTDPSKGIEWTALKNELGEKVRQAFGFWFFDTTNAILALESVANE